MSQQNALHKFFRELGQPEVSLTASAYCQARQKLQPEIFVHLNQATVAEFTILSQADGTWQTWEGHRVLGADGTKLNLPDTPALRTAYSVVGNQHGAAGEVVQGLAVVLYDLLHDLGLAAHLGPPEAGTRRNPSGAPKRMTPSRLQAPPTEPLPSVGASHTTSGAPPAMSTRFSFPPAMNAIDLLSGDQNGKLAPSVPGSERAVSESSGRSHNVGWAEPAAAP